MALRRGREICGHEVSGLRWLIDQPTHTMSRREANTHIQLNTSTWREPRRGGGVCQCQRSGRDVVFQCYPVKGTREKGCRGVL